MLTPKTLFLAWMWHMVLEIPMPLPAMSMLFLSKVLWG